MKTTTLIYCGPDGDAGRVLAEKYRADGERAMLRDAATFNHDKESCERIVIMPDVSTWQRDRLVAAYGAGMKIDIVICGNERVATVPGPNTTTVKVQLPPLTAKHRGRGKFYVMRGDEIVSGPHTKAEAQRLAA